MMLNCVITIDERVTIMAIEDTGNVKRKPAHPGEMLREDFLPDYGLTVTGLAVKKEVSRIRLLHSA